MSCRLKEIADASMQAAESLTPPQAATKTMAGIAEWQNGRTAGMADGMVKWWEWLNGGNGGRNGQMADRNGYIRTIYGTH